MPGWGRQGQGGGRGNQRGRGRGNIRMTSAREEILNVIQKQNRHMSADEIYMLAKSTFPQIGLATVYRTLELLSDAGIIKRLDFGTGTSSYEMSKEGDSGLHHYAICERCGTSIQCNFANSSELDYLKDLSKKFLSENGFELDTQHVQFYGRCKQCR